MFASLNLWPPAMSRTMVAHLFRKPSLRAALARVVETSPVSIVTPPN